jgi:anti-sigma regulatory factor (Ser/Thr protein kinase)
VISRSLLTQGIEMPEILHARVSDRILDKADRLFTNHLTHIFIELLQNARRAGATLVVVSTKELANGTEITFSDNGAGIEDFSKLLFLGEKGWDDRVEEAEDPAGMGLFSLLHSGVTIRSRGNEVELTPECFIGKAEATVIEQPIAEPATGTTLVFIRSESTITVDGNLRRACEYGPINVELNGTILPRQDFLVGAVQVKEIPGARIGIFHGSPRYQETVNFHGLVVNDSSLDIYLGNILDLKDPHDKVVQIHTKIDILSAARLHLRLPDRTAVVRDQLYDSLRAEITRAAYEYFATVDHHVLPFKVYKTGIDMGIALKEASPYLEPFCICDNGDVDYFDAGLNRSINYTLMDPDKCILTDLDGEPEQLTDFTFQVALEDHDLPSGLVPVNCEFGFEGYSWYDKLGSLSLFGLIVDGELLDEVAANKYGCKVTTVDSLQLSFNVNLPGGEVVPLLWDLNLAAWKGDSGDNPALILSKESQWVTNPATADCYYLQGLVAYVGFQANDDYDTEDQKSEFDSYWEKEIARTLRGAVSAARIALDDALDYTLRTALDEAGLTTVILEKTPDGWKARIPEAA